MTREEREKAIDLLDNLIGMIEDSQGNDYDFALKKGIEALEQEPCEDCVATLKLCKEDLRELVGETVRELSLRQKWIPCSESLPKKIGCYLVTIDYGDCGTATSMVWYHGKSFGWDFRCSDNVIAWQPLPEPYETESEVRKNDSN